VVFAEAFRRALRALDDEASNDRDVVRVGDVPYSIEGRLARGESSDVFVARRARRVTERVVIKILRAHDDADLLDREATILDELRASTVRGSSHFSRLVPQLVQRGHAFEVRNGAEGERRPALVTRLLSGFFPTLRDARAAYPSGVDPRAAVWMWRRALETLDWVHAQGRVHGAIVPQHLVLHARDHGVMLVGWSLSVAAGAPLFATLAAERDFYPDAAWNGAPASARLDVAMSARCIAFVLGGDPRTGEVPKSVPSSLAALVRAHADGSSESDALALHEAVGAAAREAFGPPAYHPFTLGGE